MSTRSRIEVSESTDAAWLTVAETRTMSGDRESKAKAADEGKGSACAAILECSSLSPRECGILELIGQGYSNKRVARALGITAETVKSHVKHVFIKLDVNTRAHAVARAQSLGLFGLEFVRPRSAAFAPEPDDRVSVGEVRHSVAEY
jgi:DNA-binding CsgD family transcriptional regulator